MHDELKRKETSFGKKKRFFGINEVVNHFSEVAQNMGSKMFALEKRSEKWNKGLDQKVPHQDRVAAQQ